MEIDETNMGIIKYLKDGRTPYKKIAENLRVTEGTIRARVKKLREEGVLVISGLVDPEAIPDKSIVMVGIKLKNM